LICAPHSICIPYIFVTAVYTVIDACISHFCVLYLVCTFLTEPSDFGLLVRLSYLRSRWNFEDMIITIVSVFPVLVLFVEFYTTEFYYLRYTDHVMLIKILEVLFYGPLSWAIRRDSVCIRSYLKRSLCRIWVYPTCLILLYLT